MKLTEKRNGYTFYFSRFSETGEVIEKDLVLDKKTKFNSGIKYAQKNNIDRLSINIDLDTNDLEKIKSLPISFLELNGFSKKTDLTFLNELKSLEDLSILCPAKGELDLSQLPNLKTLNITAGVDILNLEKAISLKTVYYWDFKKKNIPHFGNSQIEEVHIYHSPIEDLDILEECEKIKKIEIEYTRNFKSIKGLEKSSNSIEEFALRNCKNFSDYIPMQKFVNLKYLYLLNCGAIDNALLFSNFKELVYGYIDIDIKDGNVDILMEKPIIFKNYKHFNHKNNLKIKIVTNDGNYLMRNKEVLYKL